MQNESEEKYLLEFGFDVGDLVSKYGAQILEVIYEALRLGLTKEFVQEVINKFGPMLLEIAIQFLNQKQMMASSPDVVGEEVSLNEFLTVQVIIEKFLPQILNKYGDKLLNLVVEMLAKMILK